MSDQKITVAEYIADFIASLGVNTVPFVQGGVIMRVINFVGKNKKLKYVACNHEQAVAMFVDGYARIHGFGVGLATSGPGGTNLATGIACAYYDSIPCMFITGQVGMFHVKGARRVRQRGFQETDIVSMVKPITKHSIMLERSEDARFVFERAVHIAKSGRPGPVLIDVPYNVQGEMINPNALRGFVPETENQTGKNKIDLRNIQEICKELRAAKRPVLMVGGGVRTANQTSNVIALARALHIPVISTWGAADVFPSREPLYIGSPGRYGNPLANEVALESDLILALGTRFSTKVVYNGEIFTKKTRVVAVDIDRGELEDGLLSHARTIVADLEDFIPALLRELIQLPKTVPVEQTAWSKCVRVAITKSVPLTVPPPENSRTHVNVYNFVNALSDALGKNDVITSDCGLNLVWGVQGYIGKGGNQRFISAWGNSPMGYSFPAAIGAHFARPNARTVCLIGDGGMQMNIQELQTAFFYTVPIKVFVLNNYCYGMMVLNKPEFGCKLCGNDPQTGYAAPDFVKVGKAYGIASFNLKNDQDVKKNLRRILAMKEPVLINVNLHPDQNIFDNVLTQAPSVLGGRKN